MLNLNKKEQKEFLVELLNGSSKYGKENQSLNLISAILPIDTLSFEVGSVGTQFMEDLITVKWTINLRSKNTKPLDLGKDDRFTFWEEYKESDFESLTPYQLEKYILLGFNLLFEANKHKLYL